MLILTSWTQERVVEGPLPAPPRVRAASSIGLMVDGKGRRITFEMPVRPTEDAEADDHLPAQPVMRININTVVLERENFAKLVPSAMDRFSSRRSIGSTMTKRLPTNSLLV